jgi:pimeloyl-ACP methyl ester carboxylesterase
VAERMIEAKGVELCTEPIGDPDHPPVLLVHGGRFVIRYDHRDTGRSVTYEAGRPGYTDGDLVADAAGVLDAYGILAAHIAGASAGAAFAPLPRRRLRERCHRRPRRSGGCSRSSTARRWPRRFPARRC